MNRTEDHRAAMSPDAARWVLIASAACILVALGFGGHALPRDGKVELGRRVYWGGWTVGGPLLLLATWGHPVKTIALAAFWFAIAVGVACLVTPYVRIGSRVCAPGFTRRRFAAYLDDPKAR